MINGIGKEALLMDLDIYQNRCRYLGTYFLGKFIFLKYKSVKVWIITRPVNTTVLYKKKRVIVIKDDLLLNQH